MPLVPLDALQVLVEQTSHRKLAGSGEIDELSVSLEEELWPAPVQSSVRSKQPFDVERSAPRIRSACRSVLDARRHARSRSDRKTWASIRLEKDRIGG